MPKKLRYHVYVIELCEHYNPMDYEDAQYIEVDLGIALREAGYGVWQA